MMMMKTYDTQTAIHTNLPGTKPHLQHFEVQGWASCCWEYDPCKIPTTDNRFSENDKQQHRHHSISTV